MSTKNYVGRDALVNYAMVSWTEYVSVCFMREHKTLTQSWATQTWGCENCIKIDQFLYNHRTRPFHSDATSIVQMLRLNRMGARMRSCYHTLTHSFVHDTIATQLKLRHYENDECCDCMKTDFIQLQALILASQNWISTESTYVHIPFYLVQALTFIFVQPRHHWIPYPPSSKSN